MKEVFMREAMAKAAMSQDPNTKVGCVLTYNDKIVGYGCNRMSRRSRVEFPWKRDGELQDTKYPYVIHAEMTAIVHARGSSVTDAYVTLFPCSNCAKLLVEFGIKNIYYLDDKYAHKTDTIASKRLLDGCGVHYEQVYIDGEITEQEMRI